MGIDDDTDERDALRAALADVQGSAERLSRLQRISQRLTAALTEEDVISVVIESVEPPHGSTARGIWLMDPTTNTLGLAAHRDLTSDAVAMFQRIDPESDLPGALAYRHRHTIVSPSEADAIERFPELYDVPRSGRGFVAVPLVAENVALGVIAFGYDGPLEDSDVTFIEAAAGNIAQTLQRARLSDALQRRSDQIGFLADFTRAAIEATDYHDLMQRIADTAVPRLGDICTIHFIPEPGLGVQAVAAHADPREGVRARELARRFPYDPRSERGVARVLRTGEPEIESFVDADVLEDAVQRTRDNEVDIARIVAKLGLSSSITVPMRADNRVIGAFQVLAGQSRPPHGPSDIALAHAIADAMADALVRRWLADQHHHISVTLQQAYLPPALPEVPGVEVAADYWPAGVASEVGGDFYDLFKIGENEWAVLIGDACGTGADAAATAAIARHTARAAARHGFAHHEVLDWVNEAVKQSDHNLFCTAVYATLRTDPDHHDRVEIETAAAGHPLPIAIGSTGAATIGEPGTLLGVVSDPSFHVATHVLAPGDAMVFYTDGLTDLAPPFGRTEDELEQLIAAHGPGSPADLIHHLRLDLDQRVAPDRHADDAAVLVIRNTANATS